ncbi:hypothetical protein HY640_04725 [Candidatus Woesearchaeota archaeon]|nr:hypothetical protein [Candidatus Woesearchaeota archaeon]
MIFKAIGILDLTSLLILMWAPTSKTLMIYAGIYLMAKGLFFIALSKDMASYGDTISGAYMMLAAFTGTIAIIGTAVLIYLAQKTFLTFIKISIETYALYRILREARQQKPTERNY